MWQYGNHSEEIFTLKFMWDKLNYIHLNPMRAGIVEKANHYLYSSTSNYAFGKGLIDVELAENPLIDALGKNAFWNIIIMKCEIEWLKVRRLCAAEKRIISHLTVSRKCAQEQYLLPHWQEPSIKTYHMTSY